MSLVPDGGAGGEGSTARLRESPCMVKVVFALKLSFTVPSALLTVAGDSSTLRLRLKGEGVPSSETVMEVRPVGEGWGAAVMAMVVEVAMGAEAVVEALAWSRCPPTN